MLKVEFTLYEQPAKTALSIQIELFFQKNNINSSQSSDWELIFMS